MKTKNEYEAPKELAGAALAEWKRITSELSTKQIKGVNVQVIKDYCLTYAEWKNEAARS